MRIVDRFIPLLAEAELFFGERAAGTVADLREKVDRLVGEARRDPASDGFTADDIEEALFPVAVWIDEMAMNAAWEGSRPWKGAQLQRSLFDTARGGEIFFERLENLPPEKNGVREVYLLCLTLGFKGKYYLTPGQAVPDELIRRHLDLFLKSRDRGDIPSPLRRYLASSRIDTARKGGALLTEVPLFEAAYGAGEGLGQGAGRTPVVSRLMLAGAAAPVILLGALYFVFDYELSRLVGAFIETLAR
ncbi:MAG: DotU family type IV/VI secretion system protein [Nitrospinae bacterium]|nr:DotU family type IV/VI secretion system protein [Nitrospinota bacterium]